MAAQKGKDLLLKVADDTAAFVTVAGLRARQIAFNAEAVDITNSESTGRWRELLRGIGGTEDAASRSLPAGADIALIDASLVVLSDRIEDRGQTLNLRIVPAGAAASDPLAVAVAATVTARALMPLAPVHLQARRTGAQVMFSWVRRTRIDGDAWESLDVPLGEDSESYRFRLFDPTGSIIKREVVTTQPGFAYPLAQELADFAATQAAFMVEVRQISQSIGVGLPLSRQLAVV